MIAVLHSKMMSGCSTIKTQEGLHFFQNNCLDVMPLAEALENRFRTDAHFVCYSVTNMPLWPRLNKSVLSDIRDEGEDIVLNYFGFDWDNADHAVWTEQALADFAAKVDGCTDPILNAWTALYTTKHGARLLYKLSAPIPADIAEHYLCWLLHHFHEQGFANIDPSCKDWTRCFRLPNVMRDDKPTWDQSYSMLVHRPEIILDIAKVGKISPATVAKKTYFTREHLEMPAFDVLERLLVTINKETQKPIQTEYYKKAKRALKNSPYVDMLFSHAAPSWVPGTRNNEILKMLGSITPILLKSCHATIQQVFSLAINPLLTMEVEPGGTSWVNHGWNALVDIYEREVNKYNLEKEQSAAQAHKEISVLDKMVAGMREWNSHPLLMQDEETAREYVRSNCMATVGNYFFILGKEGYYEPFAINSNQVISRIRKSFLNEIIPTTRQATNGETVDVSVIQLQNQYSTAVADILMKPVGDRGGYIQDMNGEKPALVLSTFSRNDALDPTYNPYVDEWLANLFGADYNKGCEWIANALAFDEGLICALSLEGASNAGKKLLTVGLSECLKKPCIAGPMDIYGMSSAFLNTPFLVVNEAWPDPKSGISPADTFKALTGGDGIRVKEIYKPAVTILCPVRVILTANDDGIIRTLTRGKDMTLDNRIAIGERLFHCKVSYKAQQYLKSIGGMSFTAKIGGRWIRPDSGCEDSDYVVAKHFLWLYKNRQQVDASQRFLVMGNSAPGLGGQNMTVFEKLLADNNCTPMVAQAVIEMADKAKSIWGRYIRINADRTRLWVTRFGVDKYVREVLNGRVLERDVFSGMQNLLLHNEPILGEDNNHWFEVSVNTLAMIAMERGIPQTTISEMYNTLSKEKQYVG